MILDFYFILTESRQADTKAYNSELQSRLVGKCLVSELTDSPKVAIFLFTFILPMVEQGLSHNVLSFKPA